MSYTRRVLPEISRTLAAAPLVYVVRSWRQMLSLVNFDALLHAQECLHGSSGEILPDARRPVGHQRFRRSRLCGTCRLTDIGARLRRRSPSSCSLDTELGHATGRRRSVERNVPGINKWPSGSKRKHQAGISCGRPHPPWWYEQAAGSHPAPLHWRGGVRWWKCRGLHAQALVVQFARTEFDQGCRLHPAEGNAKRSQ